MFRYRDKVFADKIVERLKGLNLNIRVMHVCGTHQDTIVRYGLNTLLTECGVEVRQGPGCPVCVTTVKEYEEAITLAVRGKTIASFGDVVRVPGLRKSLLDLRAEGCDVRVVYSVEDAVALAQKTSGDVVFMAVGFETTAPSTAVTVLKGLPENLTVLCCHRYIPPALYMLLNMGELKLHGLIEPGHVSTVIGLKQYEGISLKYRIPQVVAGFEPLDVLMAVYMLARQVVRGEARVENEYSRGVQYEGNPKAVEVMNTVFEPVDMAWRGFPVIPASGMRLRKEFEEHDAEKVFADELKNLDAVSFEGSRGCRCDEILRGVKDPWDCQLFGKSCTPEHPIGPCMVSIEGACQIEYRYSSKGKT